MTQGMATQGSRKPAKTLAPFLAGLLGLVALVALVAPGHANPSAARTRAGDPADPAVVATTNGPVRGTVTDRGRSFLGVPFAAPPVGRLRWRPPAPPASWTEVRDATHYAEGCARRPRALLGDAGTTNEDCLHLNVFTPPAGGTGKPVLVWFHGGSFISGSAAAYDAADLARSGDMVVVTANYRLGPFGYLAHAALRAESPAAGSGNYGLLDQGAALRWAGDNAAAFGGDRARVTVAGQSAGGLSVCAHLVSPPSRGLFTRAVVQSAPCALRIRDAAAAESAGRTFAAGAGCPGAAAPVPACLRGKSATDILAAPNAGSPTAWTPVSGTPVLPTAPADAIAAGDHAEVPVLIGDTLDEGTITSAVLESEGTELNAVSYPVLLAAVFGVDAARVAARYPAPAYGGDHRLAFAAVFRDAVFACPTRATARWFAAATPGRTYAYEFADRTAPNLYTLNPDFPLGAYHGAEVPYLFTYRRGGTGLDPAQRRLSGAMTSYWSRFAATGDPGGGTAPPWPATTTTAYRPLSLAPDAITPRRDFDSAHQCDFWDGLPRPAARPVP